MPLIIITGYPCSGKTYRARQLASALEDRIAKFTEASTSLKPKFTLLHIPSYHSHTSQLSGDGNGPNRDSIYNSAALEKIARAEELSAIKRALSTDTIVIADDLNYIKGFRYQLWCEAKAAGTRCCTVHCAAREDEVEKWNRTRLRQWAELNGEEIPEEGKMTIDDHGGKSANANSLMPESHTALYGDRISGLPSRSRSSSMDADDGEEIAGLQRSTFIEESLRSFSLADRSSVSTSKNNPPPETTEPTIPDKPSPTPPPISFLPPSTRPYSPQTLLTLLMRYEPPSPFSRWDTPLFTIPLSDPTPPIPAIWDFLFPPPPNQVASTATSWTRKSTQPASSTVKPHAATMLPPTTGADALQTLERVTADLVAQIMSQVKQHPGLGDEGGHVDLRVAGTLATLSIPPGTIVSLPMLQRLRRRFTQIQRGGIAHGRGQVEGERGVGEGFVRFLDGEIGVGGGEKGLIRGEGGA